MDQPPKLTRITRLYITRRTHTNNLIAHEPTQTSFSQTYHTPTTAKILTIYPPTIYPRTINTIKKTRTARRTIMTEHIDWKTCTKFCNKINVNQFNNNLTNKTQIDLHNIYIKHIYKNATNSFGTQYKPTSPRHNKKQKHNAKKVSKNGKLDLQITHKYSHK